MLMEGIAGRGVFSRQVSDLFERVFFPLFLPYSLQQLQFTRKNGGSFVRRFLSHGNRPCGTRRYAKPAADAPLTVDDGKVVFDFYGIYVTSVHADQTGDTGVDIFRGVEVRPDYESRAVVFCYAG